MITPLQIQRLGRTRATWRNLIREHGGIEGLSSFLYGDGSISRSTLTERPAHVWRKEVA